MSSIATPLNAMQTTSGIWPDCRLERNLLCWARHSEVVGRQHVCRIGFSVSADINSNVDFYFLVRNLSRLLCCVGSDSVVAEALGGPATGQHGTSRVNKLSVKVLLSALSSGRVQPFS